jgi:Domain of unknown function (DUF6458)
VSFLRARAGNTRDMGIGVSMLLIAVGAILIWAVDVSVSGLELKTIGWILLIVGAVGALLSVIFWSTWGGTFGRRETVVEERRV